MLDPSTQFCHNTGCTARGKVGEGNIAIHSEKERRYICHVRKQTFAATKSTPICRLHTEAELMSLVLTLLAQTSAPAP